MTTLARAAKPFATAVRILIRVIDEQDMFPYQAGCEATIQNKPGQQ